MVGRSRVLPIPPLPLGYGARQVIPTVAPPPTSAAAAAGILSASTATAPPTVAVKPGQADSEAAAGSAAAEEKEDAMDAVKYSDANYDEFGGYSERLFASGEYDAEDREADAIYAAIDRRVESRRKRKRDDDKESKPDDATESGGSTLDQIHSRFSDVKRKLSSISEAEWAAIPESMDVSRRNALVKQKDNSREKFTPLPNSLLTSSALAAALPTLTTTLAPSGLVAPPDLTSIGRARDKMLGLRLDRLGDSVAGQTVVDPMGYMTELGTQKINTAAEVSDIKKARLLMHSVIDSNPSLSSGYIGLSRIEKDTGRLKEAREAIMRGCGACPQSEDVWIEAALLHSGKAARSVVAQAIQHLPQSIQLWMLAARLEVTADDKKAVLRRALELLPNSIQLWKAAVEMEDEEGARVLLGRAVELVPESVEMWLALARLSPYDEARRVLNRARKAVPTDSSIWITAAKLEESFEANGKAASVKSIIEKAVRSLQAYEVRIDREHWLNEAELAERSGAIETCKAIVATTIGLGVDELDRRNTWLNDATVYESKGAFHTARAVHSQLLQHFPDKKSLWIAAAQFEKSHGTAEQLRQLLAKAVEACPRADLLWLMYAKEEWVAGRVDEARSVLDRAHQLNAASEEVWLAAMKIEFECGEYERARALLTHARDKCRSARVWMKSAKLERLLGDRERERALLDDGLKRWKDEWKLWLMQAQWLQRSEPLDPEAVRDTYKQAVKHCPTVAVLWVEYAKYEMSLVSQPSAGVSQSSALARARAILETARLKNPKNPPLWLTTMRVESAGQLTAAASTSAYTHALARALQECPTSGLIHAAAILSSTRPQRRSVSHEALKRCTDDAMVFEAVARLLWSEGKTSKSREWFERAVRVSASYGDVWVWWYRMECEAGGGVAGEKAAEVKRRCVERDPTHGEVWTNVSKHDRYVRCKAGEVLEVAAKGLVEMLPGERIVVKVASEAGHAVNGVKKESHGNGMVSNNGDGKQRNGVTEAT